LAREERMKQGSRALMIKLEEIRRAIKAKLKGELSPAWCGVTKAPFLNSKNVGLIHDLDEFFHSLGDLKTSVYDFVAKFGVPDGI